MKVLTEMVGVMLTPDQKRKAIEKAKAKKMTISAYFRWLLDRDEFKVKDGSISNSPIPAEASVDARGGYVQEDGTLQTLRPYPF